MGYITLSAEVTRKLFGDKPRRFELWSDDEGYLTRNPSPSPNFYTTLEKGCLISTNSAYVRPSYIANVLRNSLEPNTARRQPEAETVLNVQFKGWHNRLLKISMKLLKEDIFQYSGSQPYISSVHLH
ncbi:hypothetical protein AVEN_122302-1 [Araneus ventricosus]|uniref:Uncharacterized protein n=1 Tax=Araneus ventricosus TaxID=182803 RepID=A0A4Y2P660_ARAVE|nr:hypothetical protein AVEN_219686-1 [Araneus ventricosus]GBN45975.1 hypothetical protein AVEN_122302-1 [Araneus ventricosus]